MSPLWSWGGAAQWSAAPPKQCLGYLRRRAKAAGIAPQVCNHIFRGTGITALENGGERARQMAAHASTRTTQLHDRCEDRVMLDEVVKINTRG